MMAIFRCLMFWTVLWCKLGRELRDWHKRRTQVVYPRSNRARPSLEELEPLILMAWTPIGPAPEAGYKDYTVGAPMDVSGRVDALAYDANYNNHGAAALFAGSASGGIWRTTDVNNAKKDSPTWVSVSDTLTAQGGGALDTEQLDGALDISTITVDPRAGFGNIVYAGTGEANFNGDAHSGVGILRSTQGGDPGSWQLLKGFGLPPNSLPFGKHSISKIIVNPLSPNGQTLFAAAVPTGSAAAVDTDGVYKSVDGGANWTKLDVLSPWAADPPLYVTDMEYNLVLAPATVGGIPALQPQFVLYAAIGNPLKAGPNNGIYRSLNNGSTWERVMNIPVVAGVGADAIGRIALAATHDLSPTPTLAVAIAKPENGLTTPQLVGVFSSTDMGATWRNITPPAAPAGPGAIDLRQVLGKQGSYDLSLALAPNPAKPATPILYLGGQGHVAPPYTTGIIRWDGTNWADLDAGPGKRFAPHPDHHAFAVGAGVVYDGNDGGIYRFNPDAGAGSWTDINNNLQITQVLGLTGGAIAGSLQFLLEGSQDNGLALSLWKTSTTWSWVAPFSGDVGSVALVHGFFYATIGNSGVGRSVIRQSTNGATTWTDITVNPSVDGGRAIAGVANNAMQQDMANTFFPRIAVSPTNGDHVIIASNRLWEGKPIAAFPGRPVWRPLQNGRVHTPLDPRNPSTITALAWADDTPTGGTVYAGTANGQLWKITDINTGRPVFKEVDPGARGWGNLPITSILIDPRTAVDPKDKSVPTPTLNDVLVTLGGYSAINKVWNSTNGGATWGNLTAGLPNVNVNVAALDDRIKGVWGYYLGTDVGVYSRVYSALPAAPWAPFNAGMPPVKVTDLLISGTTMYAGTYGRGVYTSPLPAPIGGGAGGGAGGGGAGAGIEGTSATYALGTFTAPSGVSPQSISINWGDGTPPDTSSGTATLSGTTWTLSGTHTFADDGEDNVSATVTPSSGSALTLQSTIDVNDAALTDSPQTITGTSMTPLSNALVATFTDADTATSATDFTASIDWSDGTTSAGTITGSNGNFSVYGGHTFTNAGSFPVTVTVDDVGGASATASSTATITGPISAQPVTVTATEGASTGTIPVASFMSSTQGPFTAAINWGDGNITAGTIAPNGSGGYFVSGSNTYATAASYPLTVNIFDNGTLAAVLSNPVTVADAPLTAIGVSLQATQSTSLNNVVVARFTDANPNAGLVDYTATIDWADGSNSSEGSTPDTGTVVYEGNGTYAVLGSHTYLQAGTYTPTVSISDDGGSTATANPTVTVAAAAPVVTALSVNYGLPAGGTPVTISGLNLYGATAVNFGSTPATYFTDNGDGTLTAIAPALTDGTTVDVTVTTAAGTSATSAADQYTAEADAPAVTGLSPASGATGGGNTITITGTNLDGSTQVLFGTTPALSFTVNSNTSVSAVVPSQLAGTVDVTVVTPYGTSPTGSADQYTYQSAAPTVTSLDSSSGPAAGGSLLTVTGTNLNGATQVSFGSVNTTAFTVLSGTELLVTTPALTPGTFDVTVTTPYGTSSTSSADQYTAVAAPAVTGLSSSSGPTGGGGSVTITGSGFTNASQVSFGATPAIPFTVNSDTSITATVPAASAGLVDVTVLTPGGTSALGSADQYTYTAAAPTVTAVGPNRGPTAGGTSVTLTGTNFNGATQVSFNGVAATNVTVNSPTSITATAPAGSVGTFDVTVTTLYGTSST